MAMEEVFREFRDYDFGASGVYKSTLEQVTNQYLVMLSDKEMAVREEISKGVLNVGRIPPADMDQLELQTKCFVFCQETGHILELDEFKVWMERGGDVDEEPRTSYEEIVDMIVNNKPVPGIKEIPSTVLDPNDAAQRSLPERKKPWEK